MNEPEPNLIMPKKEALPEHLETVFHPFHHPVRKSVKPPSLAWGYTIVAFSVLFLLVGGYATLLSAFTPSTGIWILDELARDTHYKYFLVLLIPTGAYFVIANWVGWQYYRNS